jgi:uncharacterized membrane protein YqjE
MAGQNGRSVPEVLQDIVGNIQEIIRSEFSLAKVEIKQEAARAKGPAIMWLFGGALGLYALGFLLLTAVFGMATVMPIWLAALIVGAVLTVVSIALLSAAAKRLKQVHKVPERTIESLKENVQWAKEQIK